MYNTATSQFVIRDDRCSEPEDELGSVIHAILLMIETRDPYTANHQRRVANVARTIASEMKLSAEDIANIYTAGILHDIGKASIPMEILTKPSRLTPYEFTIVQTHPVIGYDILGKVGFIEPVTRAILQHHERTNGSGYPHGLTGDDTVLGAKILAIADVVESMSSPRFYRPALGLGCALEEIAHNKSVLYDNEAVDICLSLFQNNELEFQKLMVPLL
jgi:putative nucleotidyltransferase with HDIG domain